MIIKYINIFHCKTLQNLPKFGFLAWKWTICQPCSFDGSVVIGRKNQIIRYSSYFVLRHYLFLDHFAWGMTFSILSSDNIFCHVCDIIFVTCATIFLSRVRHYFCHVCDNIFVTCATLFLSRVRQYFCHVCNIIFVTCAIISLSHVRHYFCHVCNNIFVTCATIFLSRVRQYFCHVCDKRDILRKPALPMQLTSTTLSKKVCNSLFVFFPTKRLSSPNRVSRWVCEKSRPKCCPSCFMSKLKHKFYSGNK
jgi:hypothetical protein